MNPTDEYDNSQHDVTGEGVVADVERERAMTAIRSFTAGEYDTIIFMARKKFDASVDVEGKRRFTQVIAGDGNAVMRSMEQLVLTVTVRIEDLLSSKH